MYLTVTGSVWRWRRVTAESLLQCFRWWQLRTYQSMSKMESQTKISPTPLKFNIYIYVPQVYAKFNVLSEYNVFFKYYEWEYVYNIELYLISIFYNVIIFHCWYNIFYYTCYLVGFYIIINIINKYIMCIKLPTHCHYGVAAP